MAKVVLTYKKYEKQGITRVFFPSGYAKIFIKDYEAKYTSPSNSPLTPAINAVLTDSRQEIIKSMTPYLEKELMKKLITACNKFCKNFTLDQLNPDRE